MYVVPLHKSLLTLNRPCGVIVSLTVHQTEVQFNTAHNDLQLWLTDVNQIDWNVSCCLFRKSLSSISCLIMEQSRKQSYSTLTTNILSLRGIHRCKSTHLNPCMASLWKLKVKQRIHHVRKKACYWHTVCRVKPVKRRDRWSAVSLRHASLGQAELDNGGTTDSTRKRNGETEKKRSGLTCT